MPPVLTKTGDTLALALSGCRGSEFQDAKEKVKEIPGRRFDFESKLWLVPANPQNADRILKTIRPEAADELLDWVRQSMTNHEESLTSPLPDDAKLLIPWATKRMPWQPETINDVEFKGALPYQRAAIDSIATQARSLLADDMGLGKTFEAISAVEEWKLRNPRKDGLPQDGPKLVVAPSSVKGSWVRELTRFLDGAEVCLVQGTYGPRKALPGEHLRLGSIADAKTGEHPARLTGDQVRKLVIIDGIERDAWVIVNWEQLRVTKQRITLRNGGKKTVTVMKEPLFEETQWLAVLADEVHRAKNRDASQTKGLWRCSGEVMVGLSGTPIMNSPDELWSLLRWLWPDEYHDRGAAHNPGALAYWSFYEDFVDYYEDHFNRKVVTGVKNPDALRYVLKGKLIRRTAKLLNLKGRKRIYRDVALNPNQQKLYDEAEKAMWLAVEKDAAAGNADAIAFARAAVESGDVVNLLRIPNGASRLVRLQQIIENPALIGGDDDSALMDDFQQLFEDAGDNQWIVGCKFKESCNLLADRLRSKYGAAVGIYTGDTDPRDRTKMEDKFQKGEIDVVIGTIAAMKEGITLTNSHLMYCMSRSFVPAENEQLEARADRLGQQELVRVYIPLATNTVAASKVEPINRLKEFIVKTVIPKDEVRS